MTSFLGFFLPGGVEIWIILAIFLLLFGHRIPSMARSMGSGIVEFKRGLKDPDSGKDGGSGDPGGSSSGKVDAESGGDSREPQQESGSSDG